MIRKVKIKDIRPNPFQLRKTQDADAIKSLAEEISQVGLWSALRGRENNGYVELCFGHRRLEAVKLLGWKEVDVDIQKLSDEEMAMQALIENLQREGLNDADKGDGIAKYIELRRESQKFTEANILDEVSSLLGLSKSRISELLKVSRLDEELKEPIRQQKIAGGAAVLAERIGGAKAVKTVVEKGMGKNAIGAIGSKIAALPEQTEEEKQVKEKVRKAFTRGDIDTEEDVVKKARQFKGQATRKESMPPDLIDVMREWTERATRWAEQLEQVTPYMDYIDREPIVAKRWRAAVNVLIEKLEKFS